MRRLYTSLIVDFSKRPRGIQALKLAEALIKNKT